MYDQWKDSSFLEKIAAIEERIAIAAISPMEIGSIVQALMDKEKIEKGIFYHVKSLYPFCVGEVGIAESIQCSQDLFRHYFPPSK